MKHLKRKLTAAILSVLLATSSFTAAPISVTAATIEETETQETATPEKEQEEAVGYASGDFYYSIDPDDGTAVIEKYSGNDLEVTIPSTIDGYQVSKIGSFSFSDPFSFSYNSVNKITISYGITEICFDAFNCKNLREIIIPDSVVYIGDKAFQGSGLKKIEIPKSVETIGEGAFQNCLSLESVSIGTGNGTNEYGTSIKKDAFRNCEKLTDLSLGEDVVGINELAFYLCSNLKSVTIPNKTKVIYDQAFKGCTNLENVKIGNGLSRLGKGVFDECKSLRRIEVNQGNEYFFNANGSFYGNEGMLFGNGEIEYDENGRVTKVYNDSELIWYDCSSEEEDVIIPEGVKNIRQGAFAYVDNVNSIRINKQIKTLDTSVITSVIYENGEYLCHRLIPKIYLYDSLEAIKFLGNEVADIYYYGTEEQWNKVRGAKDLSYYTQIIVHFLDSEPIYGHLYESGNVMDGIKTELNESWFEDNSYYNHDLARLCSEMVEMGYHAESNRIDLEISLNELGFTLDEINMDTGRDEQNYFIASRTIEKPGKDYNLVFCGCIGSHGIQWNSDFDPDGVESKKNYSDKPDSIDLVLNHKCFNNAKHYIRKEILSEYMKDHDFNKDNSILLLTGHSRGAAVVNLLAAEIIDEGLFVTSNNLFTYTFACPNNTLDKNRSNSKYNLIYNIVFPNDFVTKVMPTDWGYGRYGTTYSLPTKTNDSDFNKIHDRMIQKFKLLNNGDEYFADYKDGEKTVVDIIDKMTYHVENMYEYYSERYHLYAFMEMSEDFFGAFGNEFETPRLSLFQYFQFAICPFVNGAYTEVAKNLAITGFLFGSNLFKDMTGFFLQNATDLTDLELNPYINMLIIGVQARFDITTFAKRFHYAHYPETYCSFMLALNSEEITVDRAGYDGSVNCPVDIEITEKDSGEVVGRIVNNTVDEEIAAKPNSVVMTVDGDEKEFWLPGNGEYDVRLIGNDNGVMDYTVREIDPDTGETNRVNYYDVPVEKDKAYTDFFTSEKAFVITAENGSELTPDEAFNSENEVTYSVTVTAEGSGTASDSLTVPSGDYVTLTASPVESEFLGWYRNDTLVSTDLEYRFRPTEDISLTAKFTGEDLKPVEFGDVDVDGEVTISDATQIQMYLAELVELEDVQVLLSDYNLDGSVDISDATQIQLKLAELI